MSFAEVIRQIQDKNRGTLDYLTFDDRTQVLAAAFLALLSQEVTIQDLPEVMFGPARRGEAAASLHDYVDSLSERLDTSQGKNPDISTEILKETTLFLFHTMYETVAEKSTELLEQLINLLTPEVVTQIAEQEARKYLDFYRRSPIRSRDLLECALMATALKVVVSGESLSTTLLNQELVSLGYEGQKLEDDMMVGIFQKMPRNIPIFPFEIFARIEGSRQSQLKSYLEEPYLRDNIVRAEALIRWYKERGFTRAEFEEIVKAYYQTSSYSEVRVNQLFSKYEDFKL